MIHFSTIPIRFFLILVRQSICPFSSHLFLLEYLSKETYLFPATQSANEIHCDYFGIQVTEQLSCPYSVQAYLSQNDVKTPKNLSEDPALPHSIRQISHNLPAVHSKKSKHVCS